MVYGAAGGAADSRGRGRIVKPDHVRRRAPIARMLTGRSAATGRRIVRVFSVESESAVWADRAVAWYARQHGVLRPTIYRRQSAWLIHPGAHGRRWTKIPVPTLEQWLARRGAEAA